MSSLCFLIMCGQESNAKEMIENVGGTFLILTDSWNGKNFDS